MKFRGLFPPRKQGGITEIYLCRMLVTSIFSILLCMGCLAGTTWAWFSVSVENTENVIQIGMPSVNVSVGEAEFASGSVLPGGEHMLTMTHANDMDAFEKKSTLYVTFSVDEGVAGYIVLNTGNGYGSNIQILNDKDCLISWTVSWIKPETADPLEGGILDLRTEEETEATEETTQPTESTIPAETTATQPTESTIPAETTQPTVPAEGTATQPTEPTIPAETTATQPTESTIPAETTATQPTESTTSTEPSETQSVDPKESADPAVVSEQENT